ncbi:50S ribosomal protein chloroplastic [Raphidocelis subcapitata]|uniref:50S ribosomal protein chloroplastic n=1 Tax=Raphidocelis subcapitata TaxID=307507 RepID=A0A2V0P365_9CHLO|nr:50S ribosomal protein chloroplastic [Raphidocelis subcapitata]|eukprot:GBF94308.1 50S ribosomal protein chloroplastic [Raphidocelis subcapitata]
MLAAKASQKAVTGLRPVAAARTVPFTAARRTAVVVCAAEAPAAERLRLHNLSPQKGSRRDNKRKGRGYGGHQGGTCGFGTRGQKSRAGSGTRPGFEGGQMPLYRRLPKLRGIAGGMSAGLSKYVVVNLDDLDKAFDSGAEVTVEAVAEKGLLNISGRDTKLGLKVLGTGALSKPLKIRAAAVSASAGEKIASAGGSVEALPGRVKWTRRAHEKRVAEMVAAGLDPKKEAAKKKAASVAAKKAQ